MMAERAAALALAAGTIFAAAFAAAYVTHQDTQVLGGSLLGALVCMMLALLVWAKRLLPEEEVVDERDELPGPAEDRAEIVAAFGGEHDPFVPRPLLSRLVAISTGVLGVALLFPIASLGRNPAVYRSRTSWRRGVRMVREDGTPVRAADLSVGSVLTTFPEGHLDDPLAPTLLIRVEPGLLQLTPSELAAAPNGYVAYSKICTHAGCPVGLYRHATEQLLCPCHQSVFDVLEGAKPVAGPAPRPLAQLPIAFDTAGYVFALGDFLEPVGPDSWGRPL
jgi:ubiquinol-cytochrome c reductase iron-sulfur subunit